MAVGQQTSMGNVNQTLTNLSVQLRDGANAVLTQWAYLNNMGLAGLQALGFDATDAQGVLDMINYMSTLAQVYKGTATQSDAFNFEDALTPLWGGA